MIEIVLENKVVISQAISILIIGVIVFYTLKKEKKKHDKYFGKQRKHTNKEKQILQHYRSIYQPPPNNKKFPNLKRDGFKFEDIAFTATQIVYKNPIPSKKEISKIEKGNLVKLLFCDKDGNEERMWVEVAEVNGDIFTGILRNDAYEKGGLNDGKTFLFHSNHIYDIDEELVPSHLPLGKESPA